MPQHFDRTYRAILLSSKLFGVFPFVLVDGWQLSVSWPATVYTALLLSASCYSFWTTGTTYESRLYTYIILTELAALNISVFCSVLWLLLKHRKLVEALTTAVVIQKRFGVSLRCKRYVVLLGVGSVFILTLLVYRIAALPELNWNQILHKISYYLPTMMFFVTVMQFAATTLLIGDCFAVVSAALLKSSGRPAELTALLESHLRLLMAADAVNVCYGVQNLCVLTSSFVIFTTSVYVIVSAFNSIFAIEFSALFYPTLCWIVVYICNETKHKAKAFTEILYRLALESKSNSVSHNMKVCFHFAFTKEIVFTACGFYQLDFPLICSMTGAATSYLLILLQFSSIELTSRVTNHNDMSEEK